MHFLRTISRVSLGSLRHLQRQTPDPGTTQRGEAQALQHLTRTGGCNANLSASSSPRLPTATLSFPEITQRKIPTAVKTPSTWIERLLRDDAANLFVSASTTFFSN